MGRASRYNRGCVSSHIKAERMEARWVIQADRSIRDVQNRVHFGCTFLFHSSLVFNPDTLFTVHETLIFFFRASITTTTTVSRADPART